MDQTPPTTADYKALPPARVWTLVALNWLVPGAGWFAVGRGRRGLVQIALVGVTFLVGLALHGGVVWPEWSMRSEGFNLINNLTFVVEMGGGAPALISLVANLKGMVLLGGWPPHAYFELGSYYLTVAGAVNFFLAVGLYEYLVTGRVGSLRDRSTGANAGGQNDSHPDAKH